MAVNADAVDDLSSVTVHPQMIRGCILELSDNETDTSGADELSLPDPGESSYNQTGSLRSVNGFSETESSDNGHGNLLKGVKHLNGRTVIPPFGDPLSFDKISAYTVALLDNSAASCESSVHCKSHSSKPSAENHVLELNAKSEFKLLPSCTAGNSFQERGLTSLDGPSDAIGEASVDSETKVNGMAKCVLPSDDATKLSFAAHQTDSALSVQARGTETCNRSDSDVNIKANVELNNAVVSAETAAVVCNQTDHFCCIPSVEESAAESNSSCTLLSTPAASSLTSVSPVCTAQEVSLDDQAQWQSVEFRRKKKDALSKARDLKAGNKLPSQTTRAADIQATNAVVAPLTVPVSSKVKVKSEEMPKPASEALNLDSSAFPELPSNSVLVPNTSRSLVQTTGDHSEIVAACVSVVDENSKSKEKSCNTANDSNGSSYASVVIGIKSKPHNRMAATADKSCDSNVCEVNYGACSISHQQIQCDTRAVLGLSESGKSNAVISVTGESSVIMSEPNNLFELRSPKKASLSCDAGGDNECMSSSMAKSSVSENAAGRAIDFPYPESSVGDITFGDVTLPLCHNSSEPCDIIDCSYMSQQSTYIVSFINNDVLKEVEVEQSSENQWLKQSSALFFDTRLKHVSCNSGSSKQLDIVFGFDDSLSTCNTSSPASPKASARASGPNLPQSSTSFDDSVFNGDDSSCRVKSSSPCGYFKDCAAVSAFDLFAAQDYCQSAFKRAMHHRQTGTPGVYIYGVDFS